MDWKETNIHRHLVCPNLVHIFIFIPTYDFDKCAERQSAALQYIALILHNNVKSSMFGYIVYRI